VSGVLVLLRQPAIGVQKNVLRKWVRELSANLVQSFPGNGQMKPEQLEIERLRGEVAKRKAEKDTLKKPPPSRSQVQLYREAPKDLAGGMDI
jgi:transposase